MTSLETLKEAPAIPFVQVLKNVLKLTKRPAADVVLPNLNISFPFTIDRKKVQEFREILNLPQAETVPLLWPHILAGTAQLTLLTHDEFPFSMIGSLHVSNTVDINSALNYDQEYQLCSKIGEKKWTPKGLEFQFITIVKDSSGKNIWKESSFYLKKVKGMKHLNTVSDGPSLESLSGSKELVAWNVPKSLGRQYASFSKDINPIHLSNLFAKVSGHKKSLAHGYSILMWALEKVELPGQHIQIQTVFKGPIYLGDKISLGLEEKSKNRMDIYGPRDSRPCLCLNLQKII